VTARRDGSIPCGLTNCATFRGARPHLHALFGATSDVHQWALLDHPVPRWWVRDRIALLGDACHAMLPYLARGAAMAMEDAWSIGQALAPDPDPTSALCRCSVSRVQRATRVHEQSRQNGRAYHRSSPAGRVVRDLALTAMGRRGGDRFLRRAPLLTELFDARVLHLVRRGYSAQDEPGERYDVYVIDYGAYVDLINTQNAPRRLLPVDIDGEDLDDSDAGWVEAPEQDLRALRRAILDIDVFLCSWN